jgi:DNA transposition AAA+ family ATPase
MNTTLATREEKFVRTDISNRAVVAAMLTIQTNSIGFFEGPPGTGKTTTAKEVARLVERPVKMVTLRFRPAHLDILRLIHNSFTGSTGNLSKFQMEDEISQLLQGWGGLLIVDEVQNCGTAGIQSLRYLHDASDCSFAMLLVGWQALATIEAHPDLRSRVSAQAEFNPLTGKALIAYVRERHVQFADTPEDLLVYANSRYAAGNLRNWRNLANVTEALAVKPFEKRQDIDDILQLVRSGS